MKTNELRIGNYLLMDNKPVQITGILQHGFYFGEHGYAANILDWWKPIPLTEDKLKKAGFKPTDDHFYQISIGNGNTLEVCIWAKRTIIFNRKKLIFVELKFTKYAHNLQNLYYDLTGKELEITL